MKKVSKLLVVALVVIMAMSLMSIGGMAAEASMDGHTFTLYRIFKGTQAEGQSELASIEWGNGINVTSFLSALRDSNSFGETNPFAGLTSATDVAKVIADWDDDSAYARAFAKIAYANLGTAYGTYVEGQTLDAGYYLVVDTTSFESGAENTVYNLALLQLTNQGGFQVKSKVEIPTVEKKVKDKNDSTSEESGWLDSADYDINDTISYKLTATLGDIADYDTYSLTFNDELSTGLTYNNHLSVYVDGNKITGGYTSNWTLSTQTLTVYFPNVKDAAVGAGSHSVITVYYDAMLDGGKEVALGSAGNPNEVYLTYSNSPNNSNSFGKTPKDKVTVFTYELVVNKVDEEGEPLTGAAFELYKFDGTGYVAFGAVNVSDNGDVFTWEGLDDGMYKLVETQMPKGYNKVDDILFVVNAEHEELSDDPQLLNVYITDSQGNIVSGDDGNFVVNSGVISTDVVNESGIVLPETGGMGTTLFYVIGFALILGGVVLFITKKRTDGTD